ARRVRMKEFKGRVAVVTGAASGIGLALAERFAAEGMKVVMADVEEGALRTAERAVKARGASTLAVRTDVTRAADVDALARKALDAFGAVHVVCNNAGVGGDFRLSWQQTLENWQWVLGVNLWGVIHGIRTFVPIMLQQDTEGHVVNTASMAGHVPRPLGAVYHGSKFAVVSISESLHHELAMVGAKVKASVLCPGVVSTNIMTSERSRPAELRVPEQPLTEAEQALRASYEGLVSSGLPPATVAGRVLEAIRDERFYVFPHPEILAAVRARMLNILEQRNPTLEVPEELPLGLVADAVRKD